MTPMTPYVRASSLELKWVQHCGDCTDVQLYRASQKKVTVLEAAHSHVFNDRLFKFSGVVPDITRFCYMTLLLMSDGWSLSCILSNENALIQKNAQSADKSNHLFVCFCIDLYGWYSSVLQLNPNPTFIAIILLH